MEFFLVASAHFLALVSPGPDFFLISQTALRHRFSSALALIVGISLANAVYLLLAISGTEFFRHAPKIFTGLQYLGGGYLMYLGFLLLSAPKQALTERAAYLPNEALSPRFFMKGFLNGILNPKNIIFYLSIFTVMVSETTSLTTRLLYGTWMVLVVFSWDLFIAKLIGHPLVKRHLGRSVFYIEKFSGLALASFGIGLTLS